MGLLNPRQAEMRPTPRNALLGLFADGLLTARVFADKVQIPQGVPMIGGQGVGSLLVGKAPEELTEWSYGNAPMRINPLAGRTASFVPEMKPGRGQQVADTLLAAQVPGGKSALAMGMGALDSSAFNKAATVWHGSPHKFDAFDSSKIGTGEGAQAYGHGLYLAESPDVARSYQRDLSTKVTADGQPILANNKRVGSTGNAEVDDYLIANNGDLNAALRQAVLDRRSIPVSNGNRSELDPVIARLKGLGGKVETVMDGSLYKVDLPDNAIARMLDWDKPLSQQAPGVVDAVRNAFPPSYVDGRFVDPFASGKTGRALLDELGAIANKRGAAGMRQAEPALKAAGVPGIRYLDGGSRGAGTGTSNYVVFPGEESALQILERNGIPLATKR